MRIREIIVVEGVHDRDRVLAAVDADVVVTGGARIGRAIFDLLGRVAATRGIIVLTDPDHAGEQIRRRVADRFPTCRHAYISRSEARSGRDIGVENAAPAAIVAALSAQWTPSDCPKDEFTKEDMVAAQLEGTPAAAARRSCVGAALHIGYANAKTFLKRLNAFGVTRDQFSDAVSRCGFDETASRGETEDLGPEDSVN